MSTLPPDAMRHLMVDPRVALNHDQAAHPEEDHAPRDVSNRNPMMVFLESILPWVHYGTDGDGHQIDGQNHDNED